MSTSNTLLSADQATISRLNDKVQILKGANDYKDQELVYMHNKIMDQFKYIQTLENKVEELHDKRSSLEVENSALKFAVNNLSTK
jgi:predicted nuclease with TOPRIM domain